MLLHKGRMKELSGGANWTTNNRMELTAAVEALQALKRPCKVKLYTDSEYLKKGMTSWLPAWKRRGWKRKGGVLKNVDLWRQLDALCANHQVEWHWTAGHAGNLLNERCDQLAQEAIQQLHREPGQRPNRRRRSQKSER